MLVDSFSSPEPWIWDPEIIRESTLPAEAIGRGAQSREGPGFPPRPAAAGRRRLHPPAASDRPGSWSLKTARDNEKVTVET